MAEGTHVKSSNLRRLLIDGKILTDESEPFVIAEIGHNHQGNLSQAIKLIRAAATAGASAAKFQKRSNKTLFTPNAFNQPYNSENAFGETYGLHRESLEFGEPEYRACILEARKSGITFFATAFDFSSADFLEQLDVPVYKIASGDLSNTPLLKYIAKFNKPMIISTGGATFEMIDEAVNEIRQYHNNFAILQCTASYPASFDQLNLRVISALRDRYPENIIGYSGHDNGISMALAAYVLGARVIEKHFTLNRSLKGTDHAFSLEPPGLTKMVRDLKRANEALGDGIKKIYENEIAPINKMSKMIVSKKFLDIGHRLTVEDLEFRSPGGGGLPPSSLGLVLGKRLLVSLSEYEPIKLENLR